MAHVKSAIKSLKAQAGHGVMGLNPGSHDGSSRRSTHAARRSVSQSVLLQRSRLHQPLQHFQPLDWTLLAAAAAGSPPTPPRSPLAPSRIYFQAQAAAQAAQQQAAQQQAAGLGTGMGVAAAGGLGQSQAQHPEIFPLHIL